MWTNILNRGLHVRFADPAAMWSDHRLGCVETGRIEVLKVWMEQFEALLSRISTIVTKFQRGKVKGGFVGVQTLNRAIEKKGDEERGNVSGS